MEHEDADYESGTNDGILGEEDKGKEIPYTGSEQFYDEQAMLDELELHGFPKDEAERRKKWSALPKEVRSAIRRLHHMFGHKPKTVLLQILKGARAPKEYIDAATYFKCDACTETEEPHRRHQVVPNKRRQVHEEASSSS